MGDGYEKFEITDEDYRDAFDFTARKRKKFTKDDAIYGMWAEKGDDEEEEERKGFGRKDYTAPMSFVSGGVKESEVDKKRERGEDGIGISTHNSSKIKDSTKSSHVRKSRSFAGIADQSNNKIAGWEKHTKGIGQKLLGKMGYKPGQGLGKEGAGIAVPIEVSVRKGKGAIGAYGSEKVRDPREAEEQEPQDRKAPIRQKRQWKKKDGEEVTSYQFRTVEEVLEDKDSRAAGGWDSSQLSKVKVIDMTGKEARVLSGYHAVHAQREVGDDDDTGRTFDVAELRHNLDLLIDMSEARIVESSKKLDYEKNLLVTLEEEESSLKEALEKDDLQVKRLDVVSDLIERLIRRQNEMTLDECLDVFNDLYDNHQEDYRYYEMDQLAATIVVPIMQRYFGSWNPLTDPNFGWGELQEWKRLLEPPQRSFEASRNVTNSYHNVVWEVWMPYVRQAITAWPPRTDPEINPIIELIATWNSTLPQWMLDNILEQQVLPRLVAEIEEWDPTQDSMPVHHWIHPWLPYLDTRLEVVYSVIRHKLGAALTRWHPSDVSAKLMLKPWLNIFSRATMDQFLIKNILPKLQEIMEQFVVNPRQQELKTLDYIFSWTELMPMNTLVSLFERHFFPKWLAVLNLWLQSDPHLDEITQWYLGWKNLLPEELRSHPTIQEQLNLALQTMNRAVTGETEPLPPPPPPKPQPPPPPPPADGRSVTLGFTNSAPTFKDVVERRAHAMGVVFMPIVGRNYQGKQVFKLGNASIYIEKNVVFVQRGNIWVPVALETLLQDVVQL